MVDKYLKKDGLLWLSYPKKSSKVETELSRDHGWGAFAEIGLRVCESCRLMIPGQL